MDVKFDLIDLVREKGGSVGFGIFKGKVFSWDWRRNATRNATRWLGCVR
jgi:hypothetical protein